MRFLFGKGLAFGVQKGAIGINPVGGIKGGQLFKTLPVCACVGFVKTLKVGHSLGHDLP